MANLNVMFLLWLKLSATHILLPQQTFLNVIERKYKRQILLPDPIILDTKSLLLRQCATYPNIEDYCNCDAENVKTYIGDQL